MINLVTVNIVFSGCRERKNANLMSVITLFEKLKRNVLNHNVMAVLMVGLDRALVGAQD